MPERAGRVHEAPEVVERAQIGVHRRVAAVLVADRPGTSRIALRRHERVVGTLAVGVADRMDRREVDDIEAERRDTGQGPLGVAEGAVPPGIGGGGPGEELVPRRESRLAAIGADPVLAVGPGEPVGLAVRLHEALELGGSPAPTRASDGRGIAEHRGVVGEAAVVVAPRVRLGLTHLLGAFQQLRGDVLPRAHLLLQLAPPGGEPVDPPLDRELPLAHPIERERGVPAIVFEGVGHRDGTGRRSPGARNSARAASMS